MHWGDVLLYIFREQLGLSLPPAETSKRLYFLSYLNNFANFIQHHSEDRRKINRWKQNLPKRNSAPAARRDTGQAGDARWGGTSIQFRSLPMEWNTGATWRGRSVTAARQTSPKPCLKTFVSIPGGCIGQPCPGPPVFAIHQHVCARSCSRKY